MFEEEYSKLSRGDRDLFKKVVNMLLYSSFITRKAYDKQLKIFKTNPYYMFADTNYSLFEDYLSFMDVSINKDDQDGVIYTSSVSDYSHIKIDLPTTLIAFALRSYYEGEVSKNPTESFILLNNVQVMNLVNELGLSNLTKRLSATTIAYSLSYLTSYNILNRFVGTYSEPSYSFYITPAIRYVISSEKMNILYNSITKTDEDEYQSSEDTTNSDNNIFKIDSEE